LPHQHDIKGLQLPQLCLPEDAQLATRCLKSIWTERGVAGNVSKHLGFEDRKAQLLALAIGSLFIVV
jgi:hypothetical protein